jgi:hypothetical protein
VRACVGLTSKMITLRDVSLVSAGEARGSRNTLMREARVEPRLIIRSALVRSARMWNREMLRSLRIAKAA